MPEHLSLSPLDFVVFGAYMLISVAVGFFAARGKRSKAKEYFLGDKAMPWYVIGASMVSTNISSEHFIANVGAAHRYGIVPATGSWNVWLIYSLLIWIFLPYYVRSGIYTMPQFLERRYNSTCRYIFACSLIVGYVLGIIAASLYAGGITLQSLFGLDPVWGIVVFALITGAYTIYGGLASAAWTDFLQMLVLLCAGILVPILGLIKVGGLGALIAAHPDKFQVFLPMDSKPFPFTGVLTGFLTVGIWYSCTSQHIVQRVLSAKDEWHARMGVISAGLLHAVTPFFFVVPGIIAYHLFPKMENADGSYLMLVKMLIPSGLKGLILAGVAAALMSTVSAVLNSASTLFTIDIYRKIRAAVPAAPAPASVVAGTSGDGISDPPPARPEMSEREQVLVGQISGIVILVISMMTAFYYLHSKEGLFVLIQNIFFYVAPPFAVIFTLGLLWRRANATAAVATIVSGFAFTILLERVIFPYIPALAPYNVYFHRALLAWFFCMIVMITVSLVTARPAAEKVDGIVWSRAYARLPDDLAAKYPGVKDYRLWWAIMVLTILSIYGLFVWHRLQYPVNMFHS